MRRNPRAFHGIFRNINADTLVVPHWSRVSYWSGETAVIGIVIAHNGPEPLERARFTLPWMKRTWARLQRRI
jgi:hypothetical protein